MTTQFQEQVYEMTRKIPKGKVSTYAAIAAALNSSPRAVGQALRCNPYAPQTPCHRVVKQDGSIGGFMGNIVGPGIEKKLRLLKEESVILVDGRIPQEKIIKIL